MKLSTISAVFIACAPNVTFASMHMPPSICMSSPMVSLQPGSIVAARLDSPGGKRCEASLVFNDPDFFPLRVALNPLKCLGTQMAEFVVPAEVPNGEAYILWRCADQNAPVCTQAMISGGLGDANAIDFSAAGTVSCVVPVATITTFSTSIGASTTVTEIVISTAFSTEILLAAEGSAGIRPSVTPLSVTPLSVTPLSPTPDYTPPIESGVLISESSGSGTLTIGSLQTLVPVDIATVLSVKTDASTTTTDYAFSVVFATPDPKSPVSLPPSVIAVATNTITNVVSGVTSTLTTTLFSTIETPAAVLVPIGTDVATNVITEASITITTTITSVRFSTSFSERNVDPCTMTPTALPYSSPAAQAA